MYKKLNELDVDCVLLVSKDQKPDMNVQYYSGLDCLNASGAFIYNLRSSPVLFLSDTAQKAKVKKIERKKKDDFYKLLPKKKRLGINADYLSYAAVKDLKKKTGCKIVDISKQLAEFRAVKTNKELTSIKKACSLTKKALNSLTGTGRRESDVYLDLINFYYKNGSEKLPFDPIIASGQNALKIHSFPGNKKIKKNDLTIVDSGARINGYCSDLTRTFCDSPSKKQLLLLELIENAIGECFDECVPGIRAGDLYEVARKELGSYAKYWKYGLGHGIGLWVHEYPSLIPDSKDVLKEGMVFTIEPGLAVPRIGGARIEHTCVLTKNGLKVL